MSVVAIDHSFFLCIFYIFTRKNKKIKKDLTNTIVFNIMLLTKYK